MRTALFIPARRGSRRLPDKPFIPIRGATGRELPLIERSWRAAMAVAGIASVHVVTDDAELADLAGGFGAKVLMTGPTARNGTERCAEALAQLDPMPDLVLNLQGDAFLTPPKVVTDLLAVFGQPGPPPVATPVFPVSPQHLERLNADPAAGRVGATTAVIGAGGDALYFSKTVLPAGRSGTACPVFQHVGLYAYTPAALADYAALPPGRLEEAEGLEQLRFLENGIRLRCVEVDPGPRDIWDVNNPEDIAVVEAILAREGIA